MEKLSLNNEIVLCRAVVKKARVRVTRRMIQKLKILRSCKKDTDKEKKRKKADRLLEEILMLKKVKIDEVTKFALKNMDLNSIRQNTPVNHQDHAYATLASFPELQKRIESIRKRIPGWENQLPQLLQQLGTRSMLKKWKRINRGLPVKAGPRISKTDETEKSEISPSQPKDKTGQKPNKNPKPKLEQVAVAEISETKVDDPFFVSKKVALPKLLLNEVKENPGKQIKFSRDEPERSQFSKLQFKPTRAVEKTEPEPLVVEKLHPSWAAKKVKLIQPFEGKKIKFDVD